jgi:hypothetical protein
VACGQLTAAFAAQTRRLAKARSTTKAQATARKAGKDVSDAWEWRVFPFRAGQSLSPTGHMSLRVIEKLAKRQERVL